MNCFTCDEFFPCWDENLMKFFHDENAELLRKYVKVFSTSMYEDLMAAEDPIICEVCERAAKKAANLKIRLLNTKHVIDSTYFQMTKIDLGTVLNNEDYDLNRFIKKEKETDAEEELMDDCIDKVESQRSDELLEENIPDSPKDAEFWYYRDVREFFRFQTDEESKLRQLLISHSDFQTKRREQEASDLAGRETNTDHGRNDANEQQMISSKSKNIFRSQGRRRPVQAVVNQPRWKLCGSCKDTSLLLYNFAHINVHVSSLHHKRCEIEVNV